MGLWLGFVRFPRGAGVQDRLVFIRSRPAPRERGLALAHDALVFNKPSAPPCGAAEAGGGVLGHGRKKKTPSGRKRSAGGLGGVAETSQREITTV